MTPGPLDLTAQTVLGHYRLAGVRRVVSLGNHGGFSGARLWRVEAEPGSFCLRAWPPPFERDRLSQIHALLLSLNEVGLEYVPRLLAGAAGTWMPHAGRLWELTTWLPGRADFHEHPSEARLRAACLALATVHARWSAGSSTAGPCPGIYRRLKACEEFRDLVRSGWRLPAEPRELDPALPWAERAWTCLVPCLDQIPQRLAPWRERALRLHPCLCDVWHDHLLFAGERLTGLIDFGAVKVDHMAVDLARLLGSLVGEDERGWQIGFEAYATVRPLGGEERALARALDETGLILGAATWLRWLYHERKEFPDRQLVARHLAGLVRRLESRKSFSLLP